jgi:hypothetical protein
MRIPQMHFPLYSGLAAEAFFMSVIRPDLDMQSDLRVLHAESPEPVKFVAHGISGKRNA